MAFPTEKADLYQHIVDKGCLKQKVYENTYQDFQLLKKILSNMIKKYNLKKVKSEYQIPFEYNDKSEYEIELRVAGDVLIFMMHTNVFEFPRDHFLQNTSYVKDDSTRSYCGIINIFNFLRDSFKFNRLNDVGYLIGRLFINKDHHFYIDGKKELRLIPNNFVDTVIDQEKLEKIIESALWYTIGFDLLTPPYDAVKEVRVGDFISTVDRISMKTGKRLGFKFQADLEDIDK
jgi:hypothetical protein